VIALCEEGLLICREVRNKPGSVCVLEGMAQLAWAKSQPSRAARLFGAAEALREAISFPLPPVDRADYEAVPSIKASLGQETFAAAWAAGRATSLEDAVAFTLGEPGRGCT
jgi:hypothetical protein